MTRTRLALLTQGDPHRVTGGFLFHLRLAQRARQHDVQMAFVSIPDTPLPRAMAAGSAWLKHPVIQRADVVVLDSIAAAAAAPWLQRVRAPIVGMLHQPPGGLELPPVARRLRGLLDLWAYREAEVLMVASDWLAQQLQEAGVPRRRLLVVVPGKNLDTGEAEPTGSDSPEDLRTTMRGGRRAAALCVANWLPRKGILELLEAVAIQPDDLVTLHLVGEENVDRSYGRRVRARIAAADLRGRVEVHGVIPPAAVARAYRAADAFVLPSFEEPYGTVWGEAMAAGLPVVGWRAGNLPFLADDGVEGLLVPPGDVPALGRAIGRIGRDPELRTRLGRAAALRADTRPTWDETADRFFGVIREIRGRGRLEPSAGAGSDETATRSSPPP
jgi:glycosyltransferase involved in cell wall biosynthesis